MQYYSTRGNSGFATASTVILEGLAPDGGLYVPSDTLPSFSPENMQGISYQSLALEILKPFLNDFDKREIEEAVNTAYSERNFDHPDITPLKKLSGDLYALELWHGPTCAFKDIALQILPLLMRTAQIKHENDMGIIVLTATSGDTGKSALEGFHDVPGIKIIVYYPEKGVSEIQKLQMTTQRGGNVSVAAVKGNFDHAQSGVKDIFSDRELAEKLAAAGYRLSSANSINWGRLVPQVVYYFAAYLKLIEQKDLQPGEKVDFVVPTGNFGNILAGYYARRLGLPVNRLICATNINNVLSDFINSGRYNSNRKLHRTLSPSMDILVSSNLERLLFELTGHDSSLIRHWMADLKNKSEYSVSPGEKDQIEKLFWSDYADDDETSQMIADIYNRYHYLIDTHTAVGMAVLQKYRCCSDRNRPAIILSTASPFKFAGSVARALFGSDHIRGIGELDLLEMLARETGIAVPPALTRLTSEPVIHKEVITRENMRHHLLSNLPDF
ncbi:MAG: threonine synthase [Firmicutes bacterium ML8_F2]|nr:MAG: threonine synthase [Firmicutes bacterium ML8_F2]